MDAEDVDVEELGELILQYTEEVNALFSLLSSIHVESSVGHSPSSFSMIFMIFMIFLLIDRIVMMTMTARKRRSSLLIFLVHSL